MKLLLLFLLVASCVSAQAPIFYQDSNATQSLRVIPVSKLTPLPVDVDVSISSITIDVFPVYANLDGDPTTASVDLNNHVLVNISSETVGLTTAINAVTTEVSSPTEWAQQTVNLAAATAQDITTGITGSRKFIIVKSQDTSKQFWVSVDGAAVIGTNGMLVQDWVKLDAPETVTVSVISSETLDLSVMEAGY